MAVIDVEKNWQLLINGEWVDPAGGAYDIIDPATTEVVGHATEASVGQAECRDVGLEVVAVGAQPVQPDHRASTGTARFDHDLAHDASHVFSAV